MTAHFSSRIFDGRVLALLLSGVVAIGCSAQQPVLSTAEPASAPSSITASSAGAAQTTPHPLPFKGTLISGNIKQLPPAVAMSLTKGSQITFAYREELTHDEHHAPMLLSALNPLTYVGQAQGEYGVTAFATLTISDGSKTIADYTAQKRITKSYGMYSEPTHRELDDEARAAVRNEIDMKLYADSARLAASVGETE